MIVTDPASAETIKYAANAFLATKLSFVNAVAAICEGVGADVNDVVLGLGYDKRIGQDFLRPGPGWGGSCFAGDETLLVRAIAGVRLIRFDELASKMSVPPAARSEALSWAPGAPNPDFQPIEVATTRPYSGEMVTVRTKMGRRLTVTADHPMVARTATASRGSCSPGSLTTGRLAADRAGLPVLDEAAPTHVVGDRCHRAGRPRVGRRDRPPRRRGRAAARSGPPAAADRGATAAAVARCVCPRPPCCGSP